jgi:hypothetical protein
MEAKIGSVLDSIRQCVQKHGQKVAVVLIALNYSFVDVNAAALQSYVSDIILIHKKNDDADKLLSSEDRNQDRIARECSMSFIAQTALKSDETAKRLAELSFDVCQSDWLKIAQTLAKQEKSKREQTLLAAVILDELKLHHVKNFEPVIVLFRSRNKNKLN